MDHAKNKARRRVITIFIIYLCIALMFFGLFAYIVIVKRAEGNVSDRTVTLSKIFVLAGIFFLIMDFGHILPSLLSHNKICTEVSMRQALGKYVPIGESLVAGIYATVQESKVTAVFGKCRCLEGRLVPDENGGVVVLNKEKYAAYDIYLGITQSHLLIVECSKNRHYYECTNEPDMQQIDVQELSTELSWDDIGTSFLLEDVQSCEIKKGRMGAMLCNIIMKNGTYFKCTLPDSAGPNGDMPHHIEHREMILARLGNTENY